MNTIGSARLQLLGSAIFTEMAQLKQQVASQGIEVIDLGIGSPDGPPHPRIQQALAEGIARQGFYGYPSSEGSAQFREAVAEWYTYRFGVTLDAQTEVLTLMGSQDGLAHLPMALADPGELALVPNPGYPIYNAGVALAGIEAYPYPLREQNGYLPDLERIPADIAQRAKFMIVNYPNNPLAAVADLAFYERLVVFARKHEILIVHDAAYSEMAFDGFIPPSILQIPQAKDVCVEFHSLSKSFNMAGCRIGFLVGHAGAVGALKALKANIDYGVYSAVQHAGVEALRLSIETGYKPAALYEDRRNVFVHEFRQFGWEIPSPKATMFLWARIPEGGTSRQISREILQNTGVVVIPGDAFGSEGEGYVRIALVHDKETLQEAALRIGKWFTSLRQ
ncbi:aminotransferase class I/II-fold pyridoxal phosphate-dependent enzyme [Paenibacillus turpanensis]|uniref:aminotransferase class I/II-fold pyridoxal phosphate-dependent enzyme n=1 Tax=Paenibacillus turpanensis TaxID=2689078 RepID=UPI00140CD0D2|nr:aminotransferase class I/II-fold pyridoxal phosphate-dependent enzyme [Paenibacillus turpanensis]